MKQIFKKLTFACLLFTATMAATFAQDVAINSTNFPDDNFRAWALAQPWGNDELLTVTEAAEITTINVSVEGITSLKGIEYFVNLRTLNCSNNKLTSLDVSVLPHLKNLNCSNNKLTSLNVSASIHLQILDCSNNHLTSLNVSDLASLQEFDCSRNQLTTLDVTNLINLKILNRSAQTVNTDGVTPTIPFCGGTGTNLDPYKICTAEQLNEVRHHLDASFILMNDIDVTQFLIDNNDGGQGWLPIGTSTASFTGTFNGAGHSITGLWINRLTNNVGLFGDIYNATIKNVGVKIVAEGIKGGYHSVGGLVGNCAYSTIANSYAIGNISGRSYDIGGLTGQCEYSTFTNCYAVGIVATSSSTGYGNAGGLIGTFGTSSTMTNCYAVGTVSGRYKGGLVGVATGNTIINSFYNCSTSAQNDTGKGEPKTTAEMQTQSTFTGWNFAVGGDWKMCSGSYPMLQWQPVEDCENLPAANICTGVAITPINFPDANFRAWALAQPWGSDACITRDEIVGISTINVSGKGIKNLTGISYFTQFKVLNCSNNQLTSLYLSNSINCQTLDCSNNQLTSLNASSSPYFRNLYCSNNQLASLNFSDLKYLQTLDCSNNQFTSLILSLPYLQTLNCSNNGLTTLDVSALKNLQYFSCQNNKLTTLDLSGLIYLKYLQCHNQKPTITLNADGSVYNTTIALNNPTKLANGITYTDGKLISNSNTITTTPFEVTVAGSDVKLNGAFTLLYDGVVVCPHDFSVWIKNPDNANEEIQVCDLCGEKSGVTRPVTAVETWRAASLQAYPNPTSGIVYLTAAANIKLYTQQGGLLYSGYGNEIDLSNYAKGLYFLHINGNKVVKVVKQ